MTAINRSTEVMTKWASERVCRCNRMLEMYGRSFPHKRSWACADYREPPYQPGDNDDDCSAWHAKEEKEGI